MENSYSLTDKLTVVAVIRHLRLIGSFTPEKVGAVCLLVKNYFVSTYPNEQTIRINEKRLWGCQKYKKKHILYPPFFEQELITLIQDFINPKPIIEKPKRKRITKSIKFNT